MQFHLIWMSISQSKFANGAVFYSARKLHAMVVKCGVFMVKCGPCTAQIVDEINSV